MRYLKTLAAALLFGAAPAIAATPALPDAEPAMWVVKDKDTTIYLFGTFHALDGKTDWFNDEVRDAFNASQEVVLEIITPENPAEMRPALLRHALTPPTTPTLSSKLSPEGRSRLAATLAKNKMPPGALDRFRPFFASVTLASLQFGAMGMGAEQGSEAVIRRAMKGGSKQLGAVETVDEQFALLNALPEAEQLRILESTLKEEGSMASEITSMLAAWNRGDAKAVAKAIQQSDKESPSLYKLMFTERNARWAQWVDRRLDKPGTVFMAVGAGHLAGDRSLVSLLKKNGHRVSRVQ
ncbi:MAG: TraB/GumN family protein [Pseudomonadota bacterium]|nr:TraB/GumN family protein [Pseudomonadota bacterium]